MSKLLELQCAVRDALWSQDSEAPSCILGSDAADRLDVYRQALQGTLRKALTLKYPAVRRLVGDDFFDWAAASFVDKHPAVEADLNRYGRGLRISWRSCRHAPSSATFQMSLDWMRLSCRRCTRPTLNPWTRYVAESNGQRRSDLLRCAPTAAVLTSHFPVHGIWKAVLAQDDAALAAIDLDSGPEHLLVHRTQEQVQVLRLQAGHWHFTKMLFGKELRRRSSRARLKKAPRAPGSRITCLPGESSAFAPPGESHDRTAAFRSTPS